MEATDARTPVPGLPAQGPGTDPGTRPAPARPAADADFDTVFRALWPATLGVAHRLLGDVGDAEDAAAEGFARTYVDWDRVSTLPWRDAWIMRVVANVAVDRARRRDRHRRWLRVGASRPAPMVEDHQDAALARLDVVDALTALPARQREVLVLRYLCGLSEADVAASAGISVNSVKTHTSRALARLRAGRRPDETGFDVKELDVAF